MPKSQLRIPKAMAKQFKVAAALNKVKLSNGKPIGENVYVDANFSYQGLVDTLLTAPTLSGDELDIVTETAKAENPAKKAK